MLVIDVDAHVHEPVDWLEQINPKLAETIGPPLRFIDVADGIFGISNRSIEKLPARQQPKNRWDTLLPGFARHLELTNERQPTSQENCVNDPFLNAEQRVQQCDEQGIDVQFLNPSFLASPSALPPQHFDFFRRGSLWK